MDFTLKQDIYNDLKEKKEDRSFSSYEVDYLNFEDGNQLGSGFSIMTIPPNELKLERFVYGTSSINGYVNAVWQRPYWTTNFAQDIFGFALSDDWTVTSTSCNTYMANINWGWDVTGNCGGREWDGNQYGAVYKSNSSLGQLHLFRVRFNATQKKSNPVRLIRLTYADNRTTFNSTVTIKALTLTIPRIKFSRQGTDRFTF